MSSVRDTLKRWKDFVEKRYSNDVFYMGYDMEFHGWSGEPAQNVRNIRDALDDAVLNLYAVCLAGLGEEPPEKNV